MDTCLKHKARLTRMQECCERSFDRAIHRHLTDLLWMEMTHSAHDRLRSVEKVIFDDLDPDWIIRAFLAARVDDAVADEIQRTQ